MIGRGKLLLNSRVEKLLYYVVITRASGFGASLNSTERMSLNQELLLVLIIKL